MIRRLLAWVAIALALAAAAIAPARTQSVIGSLPYEVVAPDDNPTTQEKIDLGRLLFWDPILAGRKDVACATCHPVPATVTSPGHLHAGPAVVDAALGWDRSAQTCGTAWCHRDARPAWTTQGTAGCGTCHGVPPADGNHDAATTLTACTTCHAATMDATGNIVITGGASHHIDGVIDAN